MKVTKNTERTRALIHFPATESSNPATETSDPATESSEPKTQLPSTRVRERTHCSDLPHAGDVEFSQTITAQTNARSSSASRSPIQPLQSPSQTLYHGAFSVTGSPSTHSPHLRPTHVRSTHSRHRSDLCILYIYIYIYIYLFTFFYLLIFLIINVLLNCVFIGYVYEMLELFCLQVIEDWFLV